jgi:NlpA lipoprotein
MCQAVLHRPGTNNAVPKGEIDANIMQHTVFLNSCNERQSTDLVGIVHVPAPPMGLCSKKHPADTTIRPGSTVRCPTIRSTCSASCRSCAIVGRPRLRRVVLAPAIHRAALTQPAMGIRIASNAMPGVCRVVPRHDATVGVDFPATARSTLSIPNTDNCPGVCRLVVTSAVKASPS